MNPSALGLKQTLEGHGGLAGHWELSLQSCGVRWLKVRVKQSPPGEAAQLSREVPLGRACLQTHGMQTVPSSCVTAEPWQKTLLCPRAAPCWVLHTSVTCLGRRFWRRELILLDLFCPQTMVRPLSCRQESTSSPSPSSSLSKLAFFGGRDILKMRFF